MAPQGLVCAPQRVSGFWVGESEGARDSGSEMKEAWRGAERSKVGGFRFRDCGDPK
jgi:hypothetical protein